MSAPESMKRGGEVAAALMPIARTDLLNTENPIQWWAGFLGYIVGSCGADIGPEATNVIGESLQRIVTQVARDKAN